MTLLRSHLAPPARTLVEVFLDSVADAPDEPAVDSGVEVLTYAELEEAAGDLADELAASGIGPGDRVGVRVRSGTTELYVAILGVLLAGAAYVPVDADDPEERATLVFGEADVAAVVGNGLVVQHRRDTRAPVERVGPAPTDDAWVIFTSGSTGTPKGVAVTHRNAAAFVDAERRLFLLGAPLGPGDRVMAGLSVAFDASCEEMWLAWAYGACLVPAPRSLVRSGVDVGPWLVANDVTVVSTVPTLVALWPPEALDRVRLLILGGEACPPELANRLIAQGREVWNTYGPTEATVVACGAQMLAGEPVRIGLPLDGWDLAVVDQDGRPVPDGETGELIIGGVGLARYLDPAKDAEKYAPMPTLGWDRAYRSGDLVRFDGTGLLFGGRADDQVKLGGRRIELGEVDAALLEVPGVVGAAAAVRSTAAGNRMLVGYVTVGEEYDPAAAATLLRARLPEALVPRLAVVDDLPTRTSGKIDRDALPWPVPRRSERPTAGLSPTEAWIAELWGEVIGVDAPEPGDDFFDLGGGSLSAAQIVSRLRRRHPEVAVGDVYEHPTLRALAAMLDGLAVVAPSTRKVRPTPLKMQVAQTIAQVPLRSLSALRWLAWLMVATAVVGPLLDLDWVPTPAWPVTMVTALVLLTPWGRMLLAAGAARLLLRGVGPGEYPRGGAVHFRLWLAEQVTDALAPTNLVGAPWMVWYARLLGAEIGRDVDLHSLPPVSGLLTLGAGCSVEPEVDLTGHWLDGDLLRLGRVRVGARARIGARSTLGPGASVGKDAELAPGSALEGTVPAGEFWSGSPAERIASSARGPWSDERPRRSGLWFAAYAAVAAALAALPVIAASVGVLILLPAARDTTSATDAALSVAPWVPVAVISTFLTLAVLVLLTVRLLAIGLRPGVQPVRSRVSVQVWGTLRVLDEARTWLFPLYSSLLTPAWLRLLGARIGREVEASTVLLVPSLTSVNDQSFLADDTLLGGYELGGGWLRVGEVKIGKRAFVGNSGMAAPGRKVPKGSLVAVLSAAPRRTRAKAGGSWLGSPPTRLRRAAQEADQSRTYDPPVRLKVARALVETLRVVPLIVSGYALLLTVALLLLAWEAHLLVAMVLAGPVLLVVGALAAGTAVLAKWLLVGRVRAGDHELWSRFVWFNELSDSFVEVLAVPWFAAHTPGSPVLNLWLRALGARIGAGVWCESYWLPETDLVTLGAGSTVNRGSVVQTHLFHDRVLSLDEVRLGVGATLGPNSVILPAAVLGRHATVGPVSLVMRGEAVPPRTRWVGNPIGPAPEHTPQERRDGRG